MNEIKDLRLCLGISQQALADFIGCTRSTIAMAEKHGTTLHMKYWQKLTLLQRYAPGGPDFEADQKWLPAVKNYDLKKRIKNVESRLKKLKSKEGELNEALPHATNTVYFFENIKGKTAIIEEYFNYPNQVALNRYRAIVEEIQNIGFEIYGLECMLQKMQEEAGKVDRVI
jgi:DNA-binding XRE family transcriptional regulator